MNARMQLLKIPEVLSIKCGKRIDPENRPGHSSSPSILSRLDKFRHVPRRLDLREIRGREVIKPNTENSLVLDFEMDPGQRTCGFS